MVQDPVVDPDGSVTVVVSDIRAGDTLSVSLRSDETTFDHLDQPDCRRVDDRHVECGSAVALLRGALLRGSRTAVLDGGSASVLDQGSTAVTPAAHLLARSGDYTVRLPLNFPDYMVSDDLEVSASLAGGLPSTSHQPFRPSRTPRFDVTAPVLGRPGTHSVLGDEDRYDLTTTAVLPHRVSGMTYSLSGAARFRTLEDAHCTVGDGGKTLTCPDVRDGDPVDLPLAATSLRDKAPLGLSASPVDTFTDPSPGNETAHLELQPGADLSLDLRVTSAHPDHDGLVRLAGSLDGVRPGLSHVVYSVERGATFDGTGNPGCTVTAATMACPAPRDGSVLVTLRSEDKHHPTDVRVTAAPAEPFEAVGAGHSAAVTLPSRPVHDFEFGHLVKVSQTVSGDTDDYTLTGTVGALPDGLDAVVLELTAGGTLAADQPQGCRADDATHLTCAVPPDGRISFRIRSSAVQPHSASIRVVRPDEYDDPEPANDTATIDNLRPGVDLHLAALDPDNESPSNDDDQHLVTTRLTGVRAGLGAVRYTLVGDASFTAVDGTPCRVSAHTVICERPGDGPRAFTVTSEDVRAPTAITITVEPEPEPEGHFVEVQGADNSASARLAPRPTYDFGIGQLTVTRRTVTDGTDHLVLTSLVHAVPQGVLGLTLELTGGTFADLQDTGCARVDDTHVRCTDLGGDRAVGFRVESTASAVHDLTLGLQPPRGYDDPEPANDTAAVRVAPGVDIALGALTPVDPVPTAGVYQVAGTVRGVRTGPVTFTATGGARLTATGCVPSGSTQVTCAGLTEGQLVRFSLVPDRPAARTTVTVTAQAAAPFAEVDDADNAATTSLAPDVVLESVQVTGHRDVNRQAQVRVQVAGVPAGVGTVRVRISGAAVGSGAGQVHLTDGASGANGESDVSCHTSDATGAALTNGVYATCTGVKSATAGRFYLDLRLAHPHGTDSRVTFTVLPVGVDQGAHGGNDALDATIR